MSKWSPLSNNIITAEIAAIPEPNAKPLSPCSKSAINPSKALRVGFAEREYSYPCLISPIPSCIYVLV